MTGFPLRYVHQNILVGRGDARAALFRVETVSYPFLATAEKREWLRRLARFAFSDAQRRNVADSQIIFPAQRKQRCEDASDLFVRRKIHSQENDE